jgi:hypothetical protein
MKNLLIPALAPLLLLAACDSKTAPPTAPAAPVEQRTAAAPPPTVTPAPTTLVGFKHDPSLDLGGFYFTETAAQKGSWKLESLNIGGPSDFAEWEAGKRSTTYAPIFLAFDDVTSPTAENELGQTYHTVNFRLLPDSYSVDAKEMTFRAKDERLGEVVLRLAPDLAALKAAKATGPNGGAVRTVLTGSLQIGEERIRNISFIYHPGE